MIPRTGACLNYTASVKLIHLNIKRKFPPQLHPFSRVTPVIPNFMIKTSATMILGPTALNHDQVRDNRNTVNYIHPLFMDFDNLLVAA